jgi:hypothetical protein
VNNGSKLWNYTTGNAELWSFMWVARKAIFTPSAPNQTTLSMDITPTTVLTKQAFTANGTLTTIDGTPIAGANVTLQKLVNGTWTNVTGRMNTTIQRHVCYDQE